MLMFVLNPTSGVPTYVQLQQQVRHAVRTGLLAAGDQLPTAKEVVGALAINPNTVLKAYRELERDGLVAPRPGQGTFITDGLKRVDPEAVGHVRNQLARAVKTALAAGLDDDDLRAMLDAQLGGGSSYLTG